MKVFLSYPSEHLESARAVKEFIRSVDVACWFDKDSLVAGEEWDRARKIAQSEADVVVILCGTQTNERNGVYQREIHEAIEALRDRRLGSIYIIPLRLENVKLPPELSRLHYVDYFDTQWRRKLAGGLLRAFVDGGEQPPPPLEVAGAQPDEGGKIQREVTEQPAEGTLHLSWYQYTLSGDYWEFVNATIAARALGELYTARRLFAEWQPPADWPGKPCSEWQMHISEFYRKSQLVSMTINRSSYFVGAAHPNHGVETVNIIGEQGGIVTARDLFDHSVDALRFVTDYVEMDLKRQFLGIDEPPNITSYVNTYRWELFDQFTFNEAGMILNLSSASGLPHAFGFIDVYMPWEHIGQFLAPAPKRILLGK
jgi:hypothetical protein